MFIIRELRQVNLDDISGILGSIGVDWLNNFSINNHSNLNRINIISTDKGSKVIYIEIEPEQFVKFLNSEDSFYSTIKIVYIF